MHAIYLGIYECIYGSISHAKNTYLIKDMFELISLEMKPIPFVASNFEYLNHKWRSLDFEISQA